MDDKKDIRPEFNKSNGQSPQGQQKALQSQGFSYLTRKAEKLTTALYMVTDILSDKEPIKWRARESGVEVLSDITVASAASASERMSILRTTLKKIERVVSFLDIASSTRMITEMNAGVLKKEYLLLKDNVEAEWGNVHDRSRPLFSDRFFDVPRELPEQTPLPVGENRGVSSVATSTPPQVSSVVSPTQTPPPPQTQSVPKPELRPQPVVQYVQPTMTPRFAPPQSNKGDSLALKGVSLVATPQQIQTPRPQLAERELASSGRADFGRDDRRKIILALLKQKPSVTVGDIAKSIPGVSEKTIQRELLSMVSENILTKRGERRWSTYSLRMD